MFHFGTTSVQKLHTMLSLIAQHTQLGGRTAHNVDLFNQANLERSVRIDRGHGTRRFGANQIAIATTWQRIEDESTTDVTAPPLLLPHQQHQQQQQLADVRVRNHRHWLAESGVDVQSSVQMMFDIFAQTIDVSAGIFG